MCPGREQLVTGRCRAWSFFFRRVAPHNCKSETRGMVLLDRDPAFLQTQSPSPVPYERRLATSKWPLIES